VEKPTELVEPVNSESEKSQGTNRRPMRKVMARQLPKPYDKFKAEDAEVRRTDCDRSLQNNQPRGNASVIDKVDYATGVNHSGETDNIGEIGCVEVVDHVGKIEYDARRGLGNDGGWRQRRQQLREGRNLDRVTLTDDKKVSRKNGRGPVWRTLTDVKVDSVETDDKTTTGVNKLSMLTGR
jgi:hypothetical protein